MAKLKMRGRKAPPQARRKLVVPDKSAVARLRKELAEARAQQAATAEILKVIASSPTDVQPVFDAIAKSAQRLIRARYANVVRRADEMLHLVAYTVTEKAEIASLKKLFPTKLTGQAATGKAVLTGRPAWIVDVETDPAYSPSFRKRARARGWRSLLAVPMFHKGKSIGAINVTRPEPGEFSHQQIKLLQAFADQAVIAIENVRSFNETKEALEQKTATAEILKLIASSPSDVQPVFDAIAQNAMRLLRAWSTVVLRFDGEQLHFGAARGASPDTELQVRRVLPALPSQYNRFGGRAILEKSAIQIRDCRVDADPWVRKVARLRGFRASLSIPILRNGKPLGSITVSRVEPGAFPEADVALLNTFADQAAIAIENVRLFNETKESLERQTATAEILRVISGSQTDALPVFRAIAVSAARLCRGARSGVFLYDGNVINFVASSDPSPERVAAMAQVYPRPAGGDSLVGRAILHRRVIHEPDVTEVSGLQGTRIPHIRAQVTVPMLHEGKPIGVIAVTRPEPGPYTDKQIALLQTFADQAVIAIENVRLFKELESRTEALTKSVGQLTALGEVGQAISSTLDIETVLKTIVSRAVQLAGLDGGSIYEYDERAEEFHLRATENVDEEYLAILRQTPIRQGEGAVGRAALTGEPVQIPDVQDKSYKSRLRDALIRAGYRAVLVVPLRREELVIGALSVTRKSPGEFAPEVVELLKTFATQSAMAIQNARLFREIAEKGKQLEVASRHKSDFLASMSHELRTPLNAILGFNEMILGQVYGEVPGDMKEPLEDIQKSGKHLLRLINNVLDLAKIEAGRMELSLQDYSVHDTVESVRATLRPLAAEKGLEFAVTVPAELPLAYGDSGRITQCLMNLAGNSLKFTKAGKVGIAVTEKDGLLTYRVTDTGVGIPPDKIGSLFTEFKQTDATIASEYGGTGLGLSISKKFVEMHGGRIWIESELGKGSVFIFEIPLRVRS